MKKNHMFIKMVKNDNIKDLPKECICAKDHPKEKITCHVSKGVITRSFTYLDIGNIAFVSQIESKHVDDALNDEHWCVAI